MLPLSELFNRYVRPQEEDETLEMLHRAESGARLVGALVVGAAVSGNQLSLGEASALLNRLEGRGIGQWARATRLALVHLKWAPLARWTELRSSALDERRRTIDHWLSDVETNLRHSGRIPPASQVESFRSRFREEVNKLCDDLESRAPKVELRGNGAETHISAAGHQNILVAPLVQLEQNELWVWDGALKRPSGLRWIRQTLRSEGKPWRVEREWQEDRAHSWTEVGAIRMLASLAPGDPIAGYAGKTDAATGADLLVFITSSREPIEAAENLAARWRSPYRPVIVVSVSLGDDPLDQLVELVNAKDAADAVERLRQWRRDRDENDKPLVLFAGTALEGNVIKSLEHRLAGAANVAVVTRAHVFDHHWPPELKRRSERRMLEGEAGVPVMVARARACDLHGRDAWIQAAKWSFDLSGRAALERLMAVSRGTRDLIECKEALSWWSRGDIVIDPDGSARPAHPGWRALFAALGGEPIPPEAETEPEAHAAGIALRAELVGDDA